MESLNFLLSRRHSLKLIFQDTRLLSERPPFPASLQSVWPCVCFSLICLHPSACRLVPLTRDQT